MKKQTVIAGTKGAHDIVYRTGHTFVLEPRDCGKRTCTKCPHGPYWYLIRGHRKVYVGRKLTKAAIDRAKKRK